MAISDDWDFDYPNKVLQHIDGVLSYDEGTNNQASVGDYIRGEDSGATGKVIAVTGTAASGTLTLTNVRGLFEDNELLEVLSTLAFDDVTDGNGGFSIGDVLTGATSGDTITVRVIEYNFDGAGTGTIYGDSMTGSSPYFQADETVDNTTQSVSDVCDASAAVTEEDGELTGTKCNGTLAVPGTADENDSVIIHYDAGSQLIPEQAIVEDASTNATALVEQQYGTSLVGSLRLVDYDSSGGDFTDDNTLRVQQVVNYDNQVAGEVFSVGDVVEEYNAAGDTKLDATGRVIAVIDDGDSTGRLILADQSGTWDATSTIFVSGTKIAEVENTTYTLNVATVNLPDGIRKEQRPTSAGGGVAQGGIYAATDSLNIVRKLNSLYTLSQNTFDELVQMDDDEAMDAAVKGGAYTLVFDWRLEQGAERFVRKGGLTDTNGAEIWANPQTVGAQNKITDTAFLIDSTQTFRQPQLYIEQDGAKVDSWWLEGNVDVLLKVKTRQDTRYIAPATPALGQLIPGGDPAQGGFYAVFNREYYTSTYDATEVNGSAGGVNTVALGTADDTASDRNPEGTHTMNWNNGSGVTLLVGEEFYTSPTTGNGQKVGIVVAQTGDAAATGTCEYVLKSGTQFLTTESLTARVSGKTFDVNGAPTNVVAGYSADIRFNVIDLTATAGAGGSITGTFIPGEGVTQAGTSATGYFVAVDNGGTNVIAIEKNNATAFSGDNNITGDTSGASWAAGTGASYDTAAVDFDADLNNGDGDQPYAGSVGGDITGGGAETIQNVYQYAKYITRQEEETVVIEGPGTTDVGTVGNLYRRLKDTYAEVKPGAPLGTYTGSMALGQGWFLDTDFIDSNDIRSFSVVDDNGVLRNPPNLQSLVISGVDNGWRVAAYRATGAGLTTILRGEFLIGTVGTHNQAADSTVEVKTGGARAVSPLPADVPDSGVLRILSPSGSNNSGNYIRMPYTSVNRTTNVFTLGDTIGNYLVAAGESSNDLTEGDNCHVVFIEEEASGSSVSTTIQYTAPDIPVVFKARLKGFKPFRSTTNFTSSGGAGGVVQTADPIVDLP
jgi:hypothetical protein